MESTTNADCSHTGAKVAAPPREEDEHLSESALFHSCIDASEFFDADDTQSEQDQTNPKTSADTADDQYEAKRKANADHIVASIAEPKSTATSEQPRRQSNSSPNEASNSSSATNSSWSHLPTPETTVNSITFNRERTCVILSTSHGVRIRTLESLHHSLLQTQRTSNTSENTTNDSEEWIYNIPFESGVTYAQLLHTSSILAVILPNSPRCCFLYNAKNATNPLAALPMSAAVRRVELNKKVLICITADGRLHVFHMNNVDSGERPVWIQSLNVMHPLDSVRNIRGSSIYFSGSYFDLSPKDDECYLVCKSFNGTAGTIRVYDPTNISEVEVSSMNVSVNTSGGMSAAASGHSGEARKKDRRRCHLHTTIDAHEHPVTRMLIGSSSNSSFVATVSSKGTAIRVFSLPQGQQIYEWHRGSRACQILSLGWNGLGDRLVSYGSSNTIHVFEWNTQQRKKNEWKGLENSHADARDFEEVREEGNQGDRTNNGTDGSTDSSFDKPLLKRIGATIMRHTVGSSTPSTPLKHRSFAKLKYQSTVPRDKQQLVVAMLDRHDSKTISGCTNSERKREDTVVMCSANGELRQYSVTLDGATKLVQLEDVLLA